MHNVQYVFEVVKTKKLVIGCLSTAAIITVIVALGMWLLFFRELPMLDATLSVPAEVGAGATVTMTITTTNSHEKPVTLDSIDIDDSFLAGFQVVTVIPEPDGTTHIPLIDQRSWEFGKTVDPKKVLSVTFTLRAVKEGHYSGDIDICNPNQDFKTLLADVVVTEKPSNKNGAANGSQPIRSETNAASSAAGSRR